MDRSVAIPEDARPSFVAECAVVFAGGAAGTLARYGLVELLIPRGITAIFIANIAGCALLGYLIAHRDSGLQLSLIGTGFCGALTTFSTFQLEIYYYIESSGSYVLALVHAVGSISIGFLAVTSARRFVNRGKELA